MLSILATAFSVVAIDVAAPTSLHVLQPLDGAVHVFMHTHVPYDVRLIADKPISNWPILTGCAASAVLASVLLWRRPKEGCAAIGLWAAMNTLGAMRSFMQCLCHAEDACVHVGELCMQPHTCCGLTPALVECAMCHIHGVQLA